MVRDRKKEKAILTAITDFLEAVNTERVSKNLRIVLLDYIAQNKDYLPLDLDLQLHDFNMLFDLLDQLKK